jgi:hypothetical protein
MIVSRPSFVQNAFEYKRITITKRRKATGSVGKAVLLKKRASKSDEEKRAIMRINFHPILSKLCSSDIL